MNDFIFKAESEDTQDLATSKSHKKWRILVVDDDDSVHQVTKLVLTDAEIENRQLEIISVYSMEEAKEKLLKDNDFCMAFVDVVMETDHAGLELVQWIREELKNQDIRLVLRTGQAGSAPEAKVIKDYDINDYKNKTELTAIKLKTLLYSALRAYRDIRTIEKHKHSLEKIIDASAHFLQCDTVNQFALYHH